MNGDLNKASPGVAELTADGQASPPRISRQGQFHPSVEERKLRSFRAYLDLLDTAEWLRRQFAEQLEAFDLTIDGFRLLDILYREGAITTEGFCKRRRCRRQSFDKLIEPLRARGWIQHEVIELEPTEVEMTRLAKRVRERPRRGRKMGRVSLTEAGEKFMHVVFPRHVKLVFAFFRALEMREQESLSRTCRKLREGDVVKMIDEITLED